MKTKKLIDLLNELPWDSFISAKAGKIIVKNKIGDMFGFIDFELQEYIEDDEEDDFD